MLLQKWVDVINKFLSRVTNLLWNLIGCCKLHDQIRPIRVEQQLYSEILLMALAPDRLWHPNNNHTLQLQIRACKIRAYSILTRFQNSQEGDANDLGEHSLMPCSIQNSSSDRKRDWNQNTKEENNYRNSRKRKWSKNSECQVCWVWPAAAPRSQGRGFESPAFVI